MENESHRDARDTPLIPAENGVNDSLFLDCDIEEVFMVGIEGVRPSGTIWTKTISHFDAREEDRS